MSEPAVLKIAKSHNKTPAQVLLRHLMQLGIAVIPKSANPARIRQNFDVKGSFSFFYFILALGFISSHHNV